MEKVRETDLACDDSGSYTNNSSPSAIVRATNDSTKLNVNILKRIHVTKDQLNLKRVGIYLVKHLYSDRTNVDKTKFSRIITRTFSQKKIAKFSVNQYIGLAHKDSKKPLGISKSSTHFVGTKP